MKKLSVILLLLGLVVIAGCHNDKEEESVVCTCELRQINIRAVYTDGTPVVLDKFETINLETGQKMEFGGDTHYIMDAYYKDSGQYPVMNDDYRKELENKPLKIKFLGYKNEQVVIEEAFIVSADECHVYMVDGNDSVIFPLPDKH